jgi:hypothetical protein
MARVPFPVRERNRLGGPVDVKNPQWVHQNLQIYGDAIAKVAEAFSTDDPFAVLGFVEDEYTRSIEKWSARPCQVDDSYLISYETYQQPALAFCEFLATVYGLQVCCECSLPFKPKSQMHYMNWKRDIAVYDEMGNRLKKRRKPKNGA